MPGTRYVCKKLDTDLQYRMERFLVNVFEVDEFCIGAKFGLFWSTQPMIGSGLSKGFLYEGTRESSVRAQGEGSLETYCMNATSYQRCG